ncbi:hypothetical protein [Natrononativus amylolyticus]|uniref:hypothetical protein n=1 Tax=Natrononativus amylolyticus TaxID=2963434 RepID=UPI0020CC0213|nr:hypothetical protein [Natrononativus amylolyticus]
MAVSSSASPIRLRVQDAVSTTDHDLVGEPVIVPHVDAADGNVEVAHTEGQIVEVHTLSGEDPDIITVALEEEEEANTENLVHIDLTAGDLAAAATPTA